jgi:uncharacterized protein YndB with AHSA1/START domain
MKKLVAIAACAAAPFTVAAERAIEKEIVVNAPLHAAWSAWTTSEGIQSFFAPEAVIEAKPEGKYFVHFNPYGPPGSRGADDMRVLAVQADRMISFTWNAPPHLPEARAQRTVVIVRTEPVGEKQTRVKLTHVGWGDGGQWDEAYNYFDAAWPRVLASLQKRFSDGPVDWTPRLQQLKDMKK